MANVDTADLLYIRTHLDLLLSAQGALGKHIASIEADIHVLCQRLNAFDALWKEMANFKLTHVELRNQVIANRAEQDKHGHELRRLKARFEDTAIDDHLIADFTDADKAK